MVSPVSDGPIFKVDEAVEILHIDIDFLIENR